MASQNKPTTSAPTVDRRCSRCGLIAPHYLTQGYCKECQRKLTRLRMAALDARPERREMHRRLQRAYRQKHPAKIIAHQVALKIPTSRCCEACGAVGKLHKHHPDYSRPEYVVTLCVPCHEKEHHNV